MIIFDIVTTHCMKYSSICDYLLHIILMYKWETQNQNVNEAHILKYVEK